MKTPLNLTALDNGVLSSYLPGSAYETVLGWISSYPVRIVISGERITKSGDYRPPENGFLYHRISINRNLNNYAFLITLAHEFAHLLTWNTYRRKAKPHGHEWKDNYRILILSLIEKNIFPKEIEHALINVFVRNGKSVHEAEYRLSLVLSEYDIDYSGQFLAELVPDSVFSIRNGNMFRKGDKVRTRYKCFCLNNKRWYLVSPAMKVRPVSNALNFSENVSSSPTIYKQKTHL
ncbi:MAG TPA: SprT-like domain-containing protein [Bacteroidales bacterium]|nr:SprT-like domain-containing protein [Bacteroidales bacterium]